MSTTIKQLLVHLDARPSSAKRLAVARQLAEKLGASLHALYAATPSFIDLPFSPEIGPMLTADMLAFDETRRTRVKAAFDKDMQTPGPLAQWAEVVGMPIIGSFSEQALYADLLVLGQHDPSGEQARDVPKDFPESVIVASGKPALLIPYTGNVSSIGTTVLIAWKETREAAHAVTAAVPFLQAAKAVHVVSWAQRAADPVTKGNHLDLTSYLHAHGVKATWHRYDEEPAEIGELLLSKTFDLEADLLVMGCYGHARAREWLLGGTSRTVFSSMTLPVLLAH